MRGPQPWRTNRARVLRSRASPACEKLWSELRNRRLDGLKFVRECAIGPFYADFVCRDEKVIVEIDGGTHSTDEEIAYDKAREAYLLAQGFRIFWAHNGEVYDNIDGVCDTLLAFISWKID
ncbi:unnamed protein product [Phaeothamnion confervicola]